MITALDFYHVMTAMVPLYVAMILAYGSVKWWHIFTPDQCSGINRFVALFAVPLLSFHFIALNNPYTMNFKFILADTLQKLVVLVAFFLWSHLSKRGSLEWTITLFSLSTLPNTLVMGIPLLKGMYGEFSGSLMVQIVVLQCIIWYTLMLFMFEYRAARILINDQFPGTGGAIVAIHVEPDVISLDRRRQPLETEAEVYPDGKVHVTVRRSNASRSDIVSRAGRPSNLSNAEIYSLQSSRNPTPRGSNFNYGDFGGTPRASNYEEGPLGGAGRKGKDVGVKDLHMFVWSSSNSPVSDVFGGGHDYGVPEQPLKDIKMNLSHHAKGERDERDAYLERGDFSFGNRAQNGVTKVEDNEMGTAVDGSRKTLPPTSVMTRLILIMVWRKLIRNPNTYSSLIGLTWSLVSFRWHVEMPAIIAGSISILSDAGLGMAMFSLGLFMALQPRIIACGNRRAAFAMSFRFLVGPAVMAASSLLVGLRGVLLRVAIVQAALPQGIVPFVFAKEYNVHPDILSTAVIFGMLIALPITLVYYILLGL